MNAVHDFTLLCPPSANRYWRSAPGKGLVPSKEAERYKRNVAMRLCALRPVWGRYSMSVAVAPPRADYDLGNCLKVLEDALQLIAIMDDRYATAIQLVRVSRGDDGPFVHVRIEGERFATLEEVEMARRAKAEASKRRRRTLAANRRMKAIAGSALKRLRPSVVQP